MTPVLENERQLLQQLVQSDAEAFRRIYEFYQGRVFMFALRYTKSREKAEEVTQEVFVRIWEKRHHIEPVNNFNAYIITITRNLIVTHLQKAQRDRALQEKIYRNMQALKEHSADELIEKELRRLHQMAIDQLSPSRKKVYLLSREEELSYKQIAERLGISANTVRNQMTEALASIREYLSNHPDLASLAVAIIISEAR